MTIYMRIKGIEGDVTAKNHEKWIQLDSLSFHVKRGISVQPGRSVDKEGSKPALSELTLSKVLDQTSPLLFSESCIGKAKDSVVIHLCTTSDTLSTYMEYTLSHVIVSGYSLNHRDESSPIETLNLSFDKIEMKYTPYGRDHQPKSPVPAGYDLTQACAL